MKLSKLLIINALMLLIASCSRDTDQREYEIMPDMARSYALKPQEADPNNPNISSMRVPPKGTVPRGFQPYPYEQSEGELAGAELFNPIPATKEVIETGKKYYNINCVPCHGTYGAGDGNVVTKAKLNPRMPAPPALYSDKLKNYPDGRIYHIIMTGQGANMPSYANRMDVNTRWAVVNYVRVLQDAARME